jgi:phosphoglycerate dehydrogenase-like enzyme
VELLELDALLSCSDYISLHAPLTKETEGLLDRERLKRVKPGAVIVNLARGGLFESLDLIFESLNSGQISGLGLDVFPQEPPDVSHPLFLHPGVLCAPHALGLSLRAAHNIFAMMTEGMVEVLEGKAPWNVVNPQIFSRKSSV